MDQMTAAVIDIALVPQWAAVEAAAEEEEVTHLLRTKTIMIDVDPLEATALVAMTTAGALRLVSSMTGVMEVMVAPLRVVAWEDPMRPDHLPVATTIPMPTVMAAPTKQVAHRPHEVLVHAAPEVDPRMSLRRNIPLVVATSGKQSMYA